jgi:hypothetical protein
MADIAQSGQPVSRCSLKQLTPPVPYDYPGVPQAHGERLLSNIARVNAHLPKMNRKTTRKDYARHYSTAATQYPRLPEKSR